MTDQEILAKWRARRGPVALATAKALQKLERRFGHLGPKVRTVHSESGAVCRKYQSLQYLMHTDPPMTEVRGGAGR